MQQERGKAGRFLDCSEQVIGACIEVKATEQLLPIHEAQVLTYLKLTGLPTGLLVNFGAETVRRGLRRLTNK